MEYQDYEFSPFTLLNLIFQRLLYKMTYQALIFNRGAANQLNEEDDLIVNEEEGSADHDDLQQQLCNHHQQTEEDDLLHSDEPSNFQVHLFYIFGGLWEM